MSWVFLTYLLSCLSLRIRVFYLSMLIHLWYLNSNHFKFSPSASDPLNHLFFSSANSRLISSSRFLMDTSNISSTIYLCLPCLSLIQISSRFSEDFLNPCDFSLCPFMLYCTNPVLSIPFHFRWIIRCHDTLDNCIPVRGWILQMLSQGSKLPKSHFCQLQFRQWWHRGRYHRMWPPNKLKKRCWEQESIQSHRKSNIWNRVLVGSYSIL